MTPPVLGVVLFFTLISLALTNKTKSGALGFRDKRHELVSQLKEGYNPEILPVRNISHAVIVQYDMSLNQIIDVVEKDQYMVTSTWVRLFWKDEFLTWDPADFDGVDRVHLNSDSIWKPDLVLYNSVDTERVAYEVFPPGIARVNYLGIVSWPSPVIMQTTCKIEVAAYPFDEQNCELKFGSWNYNGFKLNLTNVADEIQQGNYISNVEWELLDAPCKTEVTYYDCCPEPYMAVVCTIHIRRRPGFYLFNLVLPTTLLLIIGLLVFCLPPESGEKVSLAITVLLSISVYMLIVMDNVPPNGEAIPLLEFFIGGTVCLLTLSTVMAVLVVNFHFRGSYSRPPYWIRFCCMGRVLTTICFLRKEVKDIKEDDEIPVAIKDLNNAYTLQNGGAVSLVSLRSSDRAGRQNNNSSPLSVDQLKSHTTDTGTVDATHHTLQQIQRELQHQSQRMRDRHREEKTDSQGQNEWRLVAMTIDRLFFIILTTVSLIMSFFIFKDELVR